MSAVMRVLVCGSRNFLDVDRMRERLSQLPTGTTIIHGGARGADSIADEIARELGFTVEVFKANFSSPSDGIYVADFNKFDATLEHALNCFF